MLHARLRAAAANSGIPQDYIALWDMSGDATDDAGTYDMSLFNGATHNPGYVSFDGIDDYGQCPRLALDDNAFTLVTRVRFDAFSSDGVWLASSRSSDSGSGQEWQLLLFQNGGKLPQVNIYNTSGVNHIAEWSKDADLSTWHTISVRFSGTSIQIFDGDSPEGSSAFSGSMNTGAANTQFAKRGWQPPSPQICGEFLLSRTIVYDYAVSDEQLSRIVEFIQ